MYTTPQHPTTVLNLLPPLSSSSSVCNFHETHPLRAHADKTPRHSQSREVDLIYTEQINSTTCSSTMFIVYSVGLLALHTLGVSYPNETSTVYRMCAHTHRHGWQVKSYQFSDWKKYVCTMNDSYKNCSPGLQASQ